MTTILHPIRWFYCLIFWSGQAFSNIPSADAGFPKAEFRVQIFHFQLLVLPQWYFFHRLLGSNDYFNALIALVIIGNFILVRFVLLSQRATFIRSFSKWPYKRKDKMADLGIFLPFLAIPVAAFWLILLRA